jgi:membrane-bound metal-dependent hydrolase YbcI (DUF457 family)
MVDVMGHVAFGLLFALPAWVLWRGRVSVAFIALTATMAMLPDVDLWLSEAFPATVQHHGVAHTVLFVTVVSVLVGAVVTLAVGDRLDEWTNAKRFNRTSTFLFVTGAFTLGGVSHLCADMLSAPDLSAPLQPFWPFFAKPWSVDVVWYNSIWINFVLLVVAVLIHLAIGTAVSPFDREESLLP